MSNIDQELEPSESYVASPRTFKGLEVQPYSLGRKMLLAMITREGDPNSFFLFSLLYVLTHPREEVQRDAADKNALREKILSWLDSLDFAPAKGDRFLTDGKANPDFVSSEDEQALDFATKILQEAAKEKVDPIASGGAGNG